MDKNKVYYVFKHGHCLDKFDDIYLAEAYAKYCGGKVYTSYVNSDNNSNNNSNKLDNIDNC